MPVYEFRFPAKAAGLAVSVQSGGVEVATTTAPASLFSGGPVVFSLTLDAGDYEAVASNPSVYDRYTAPGTLLIEESLSGVVPYAEIDLAVFLLPGETMPNDGVTDAKPILQRAVDGVSAAANAVGPKQIVLPAGEFRINSSVDWAPNVGVKGAGRGSTKIQPYGNAVFGRTPSGWVDGETMDNIVWEDFTIDCTNQTNATEEVGIKGVAIRWMKNGRFERIRILNSWATAFGCDFLQDVVFDSCSAIGAGRGNTGRETFGAGFGIGVGNYDTESVQFINCYAEGCYSAGFFVERIIDIPAGNHEGRGFSMVGCTALGNYDGLHDMGATGLTVTGCHFLNNTRSGIYNNGGSVSARHGGKDGLVSNTVIRGNGDGVLVVLAATGGYTFANNDISENAGAGVKTGASPALGPGWRFFTNKIVSNGAGGILLDAPMLGRPEFIGNSIRENGHGPGIRLGGDVWEPKIIGNTIQGHIGPGIHFVGATSYCQDPFIQQNIITENSGGGFVNEKVTNSSTLVTGNRETASFTTITNPFPTPSYELDVSQVVATSNFTSAVQATAGGAKYGTYYASLTVTGTGSAVTRVLRRTAALSGVWTVGVWVRTHKDNIIRASGVAYWASNASQRSTHKGGIRATGDWQRVSVQVLLPSDGSRIDLNISLDNPVSGSTLHVDGASLTPGTVLWPYFDGANAPAMGGTVAWSGTAYNSASVWTVPA